MSDPYAAVKPGRLTFKGGGSGGVATQSKSIHKKKNKKRHQKNNEQEPASDQQAETPPPPENIYTIDAAKKMNYEELFPVEAKKFSYRHPKAKETSFSSVEEALDDRVKKKADRYCK